MLMSSCIICTYYAALHEQFEALKKSYMGLEYY